MKEGQIHLLGTATQSTFMEFGVHFSRTPAVEVVIEPFSSIDCIIKVQSIPLNGTINIKTKSTFLADTYKSDMILVFIFALLFFTSLSNFLIYFVVKNKLYLICSIYTLLFLTYQFIEKNLTKILIPNTIDIHLLNDHYISIFSTLATLAGALFFRLFLRLPEKVKVFNVAALVLVILASIICISTFFPYSPFTKRMFSAQFGLASQAFIIAMFIYTIRFKTRESFVFIISYLPIITATILFILSRHGLLTLPGMNDHLLLVGGVFDVIFLTVGLTDSIKRLKSEKASAELQRFHGLRIIAAELGDSLNSPLSAISHNVQKIMRNDNTGKHIKMCDKINAQVFCMINNSESLKKYRSITSQKDIHKTGV